MSRKYSSVLIRVPDQIEGKAWHLRNTPTRKEGIVIPKVFTYNILKLLLSAYVDREYEGGINMATSSIFHNVKIDTPEKAEAFVAALEASEKEPWVRVSGTEKYTAETNYDVIRKLHEMRKMKREQLA